MVCWLRQEGSIGEEEKLIGYHFNCWSELYSQTWEPRKFGAMECGQLFTWYETWKSKGESTDYSLEEMERRGGICGRGDGGSNQRWQTGGASYDGRPLCLWLRSHPSSPPFAVARTCFARMCFAGVAAF
ncbi:unnamed protein product [Musa hybrid cultivar]